MSSRRRMLLASSGLRSKGVINGVIQDDLNRFVKICQAGLAPKFYSVGDHILIPLADMGSIYMDYLGSELDTRADGKSGPVSSWLCRYIVTDVSWNGDFSEISVLKWENWKSSYIRNYCRTVIYNALPDVIKNNIISVIKTTDTSSYNGASDIPGDDVVRVTTEETVWIPSLEELSYQTTGKYTLRFPKNVDRAKTKTQCGVGLCGDNWWLRSLCKITHAGSTAYTNPCYVYNYGSIKANYGANSTFGLVFGFCI